MSYIIMRAQDFSAYGNQSVILISPGQGFFLEHRFLGYGIGALISLLFKEFCLVKILIIQGEEQYSQDI